MRFASLRDAVWQRIRDLEQIRDDFATRVRRFNPTWIINACTGGPDGWGKVDGAVSEWLLDAETGCQLYATTHPATWHWSPPRLTSLSRVDLNHATADEMKRILIGVGSEGGGASGGCSTDPAVSEYAGHSAARGRDRFEILRGQ